MAISSQAQNHLSNLFLYGYGHLNFEDRSSKVVKLALDQLHSTPLNIDEINKLFFKFIDFFGTERYSIAKDSGSLDFENFGKKRTDPNPIILSYANTLLEGQYDIFAKDLLQIFSKCIENVDFSKSDFTKEPSLLKEDDFSFECQILDMEDMAKAKFGIIPSYQELMTKLSPSITQKITSMAGPEKGTFLSKVIKTEQANFYHQTILSGLLLKIEKKYSFVPPLYGLTHHQKFSAQIGNESIFLQGTARFKIQNKMYATSKYYTWINFNKKNRSSLTTKTFIEKMISSSKVVILHQDQFLINDTLNEIANIFTKAILLNSKDDHELIELVAKFRYLFASCMPYRRGSAAIGEWFEKLIYQFHNKKTDYKKNIDLIALTKPLFSDFLKIYINIIKLI